MSKTSSVKTKLGNSSAQKKIQANYRSMTKGIKVEQRLATLIFIIVTLVTVGIRAKLNAFLLCLFQDNGLQITLSTRLHA